MNGEFLELYNKIDARMTKTDDKVEKHHEENLKTFGKLQCGAHRERMKSISGTLTTHWAMFIFFGSAFGSAIGGIYWWIVTH